MTEDEKPPQTAMEYCLRAEQRFQAGDFDGAIADYSEAIRLDSRMPEAWCARGAIWGEKGEYDKALADSNEALRLKPDYVEALNNRGNAWGEKGEYDKAIADYDEAIRLKPDHVSAWNNRGNAWLATGEYDKAIADYDEAIHLKPDYAEAWLNRGNAWDGKNEYDKAIADFDEAIRLKPDYEASYFNRGNAWLRKSEYDKAIADYDEALRLKPNYKEAIHNRAAALALQASEKERKLLVERLEKESREELERELKTASQKFGYESTEKLEQRLRESHKQLAIELHDIREQINREMSETREQIKKEYSEKMDQNLEEVFERVKINTEDFQTGYDENLDLSKKYEARANNLLRWLGVGLICAFLLIFSFESSFIRIDSFNLGLFEFGFPEIPPPPPNEISGATQLPAPDNCEHRADCCVQVYQNGCPPPEVAPSNGNTLSPLRLLPWLPVVTAISAPFFLWWWGLQRRRYETLTLAYGFQRKKIVEERVDIYSRKFPELHKDLLKVYVLHWMEKSPLEVMLAIGGKSKGMGGASSAATELLREMEKTLIDPKDKAGKDGGT